jgi:hypothetical protein
MEVSICTNEIITIIIDIKNYICMICTLITLSPPFYIDYYTQNHEIQGNTVIRVLLYFLVFRDFECNNRYETIIDINQR